MKLCKPATNPLAVSSGRALALAAAIAIIAISAGCGGGGDEPQQPALAKTKAEFELPDAPAARTAPAPLMDTEGRVLPGLSEAVPADRNVRTQQQRYATRQQAQALMQALQGEVLMLQVDCCAPDRTERAVNVAFDFQAEHDYSNDVPVLVRGSDLRDAVSVVDRLTTAGMNRVWLVTH